MSSSLSKMLAILDVFDEAHPAWTADGICELMGFTTSSGYRYIRELCEAGLLTRTTGGVYVLGTRIIELEYVMRISDPLAKAGTPVLADLAETTGCDVLLSTVRGFHVMNVLHVRGVEDLKVTYIRGRLHPLFRGAVSKAILPYLPRTQLVKLHGLHEQEISEAGLGNSWLDFWRSLQAIKLAGFSESHGELDPQLSGLGCPIFGADGVVGSISIVFSSQRFALLNRDGLVQRLKIAAEAMSRAVQDVTEPSKA